MLHTLTIRDLALIEHAEISLAEGFNVISGETGGGKSLVIAAIELLRGCRAGVGLLRHGAAELRVDGEFRLGGGERSEAARDEILRRIGEGAQHGAPSGTVGGAPSGTVGGAVDSTEDGNSDEDEWLIVTRIVDQKGRSRARVNGRPVTLAALREIGEFLIEIHGQGDSRALMRPEIQCETLDGFAGTHGLRRQFAAALARGREIRDRLEAVTSGERERQSRLEFLRFQRAAMAELDLQPGEVAALEQEHRILAHLDRMREYLTSALGYLLEESPSASDLLGRAGKALRHAAEIDRDLAEAAESVEEARIHVTEAARSVETGLSRLDLDPSRLAAVEERLAELRGGLSRFGPTEADFAQRLREVCEELDGLCDEGAGVEALEAELAAARDAVAKLGRRLVRARRRASQGFATAVAGELGSLGMPNAELLVAMDGDVDPATILDVATAHGPTPVDFVVRINPGEPARPMRETASGGEMARIVLAIKKTLADQDRVPFLVFDEVDAEIGGRLGFEVGAKLQQVAAHHQVLIVTHLPQVAAFADAHFKVTKVVAGNRTLSGVERLGKKAADHELAEMSVGGEVDAEALREARRMRRRATGQ